MWWARFEWGRVFCARWKSKFERNNWRALFWRRNGSWNWPTLRMPIQPWRVHVGWHEIARSIRQRKNNEIQEYELARAKEEEGYLCWGGIFAQRIQPRQNVWIERPMQIKTLSKWILLGKSGRSCLSQARRLRGRRLLHQLELLSLLVSLCWL